MPTVGETIPGYEFYSWYGLIESAKLPADINRKAQYRGQQTLSGDMKEKLKEQGILATTGTSEDFAKFQRRTWNAPRRS